MVTEKIPQNPILLITAPMLCFFFRVVAVKFTAESIEPGGCLGDYFHLRDHGTL